MIKKIKINKFARFDKFKFDRVNEFERFNVLYGWNYSGKTTLSRAFAVFDKNELPPHYDDGIDFELESESVGIVKSIEPTDLTKIKTKVFNSDYIEENLFFKTTGASNILVLADKAQDIMEKIEKIDKELDILNKNVSGYKKQETENKTFLEKTRTKESAIIKEKLHTGFTATTFLSYANKINSEGASADFLIKDDDLICKKRSTAISEKDKINIPDIPLISILDTENIKNLLNEIVSISHPLERLNDNKNAEKWVREGITHHKDSSICFYCGEKLTQETINGINAHFDKSYTEFIEKSDEQKNNTKKIPAFTNLPDTSSFYEQFENKYLKAKVKLEEKRESYNYAIGKIHKLIEKKQKTVTQTITFDLDFDFNEINKQIQIINTEIISKHNTFNDDFDSQKDKALEELKKHYVLEILLGKDYQHSEKLYNDAIKGINETNTLIKEKRTEKAELEAKISESDAGADKINKVLDRLFMGNSDIKIEPKSALGDDKYVLKRCGTSAHNLSEGEKTAMAFAHFIACLDSKDLVSKHGNIILFIDDPISSLDNNHIYSVYAEIKRLKNEESLVSGKKQKKYKQIFVSTHNYNLFNLLTGVFNK